MSASRELSAARRARERRDSQLAVHRGGADVVVMELVKSFGPVDALRGVSLTVGASEFVTITGPSGSGKSTLLNLIGSLDRPDSGTITVAGVPVPEPRHAVSFRRQIVGFVFQERFYEPTPGLDDVAFINPSGERVLVAYNSSQRALRFAVSWRGHMWLYREPPRAMTTFSWK